MLTLSPVFSLLPIIKIAFGFATPLLLGIAGVTLCRKRLAFGLVLMLAALLILMGFAAPMFLSGSLLPAAVNGITLACNSGWFLAGLALVLIRFDYRTHGRPRSRPER